MNKIVKYILIICPIILSLLLGINIYKYISSKNQNENLIDKSNTYELKNQDNLTKKEKLEQELTSLKEKNKDKIERYEKWIKWNEEMQEKIN